jgi:phosphoribosyl 1,2-cyclic phosphate phosphodiesterase
VQRCWLRTLCDGSCSCAPSQAWIERVGPKRAILTHMHRDLDYETLRGELPQNVEPAYDGMRFELPG